MTSEQIELRKKAAVVFHLAIEVVANIKGTGWETPTDYIICNLRQWAKMYGYKEVTK